MSGDDELSPYVKAVLHTFDKHLTELSFDDIRVLICEIKEHKSDYYRSAIKKAFIDKDYETIVAIIMLYIDAYWHNKSEFANSYGGISENTIDYEILSEITNEFYNKREKTLVVDLFSNDIHQVYSYNLLSAIYDHSSYNYHLKQIIEVRSRPDVYLYFDDMNSIGTLISIFRDTCGLNINYKGYSAQKNTVRNALNHFATNICKVNRNIVPHALIYNKKYTVKNCCIKEWRKWYIWRRGFMEHLREEIIALKY